MKFFSIPARYLGLVLAVVVAGSSHAIAQPPAPDANQDVQVLQNGPIHEAYAQPTSSQPVPGAIAPKKPPDPIPEVPPEEKPAGKDVIWIPGYWWWDLQKNDFIWVSGIWRAPPPGHKWVPGYWTQTEDGWQWVSGFWASDDQAAIQYLSPPPQSVDAGPNVPAPGDNYSWVPGTWLFQDGEYVWQPGFWAINYPGWIYTPPCYTWTPSGCVFVDGYWDYDLAGRGWLFAPVWFGRPLWNIAGWAYTPSDLLDWSGLLPCLFFGPSHHDYYFGDYYGANFWDRGFRPWGSYASHLHDGMFQHYQWVNRNNPGWAAGLRREASSHIHGGTGPGVRATPLNQLGAGVAHAHVTEAQREQHRVTAEHFRQGGTARREMEHPEQAHPVQVHPEQVHPEQVHPEQVHPEQAHPEQVHPEQAHETAPGREGHPTARAEGRVVHTNRLPEEINHAHANLNRSVRPPAKPSHPASHAPAHPVSHEPARPAAPPHEAPSRPSPHPSRPEGHDKHH